MLMGEHTYTGSDFEVREFGVDTVTVGRYCSIADSVLIYGGGEHDTTRVSTYPFDIKLGVAGVAGGRTTKGPVVIGNDVWIGSHVIILSGVTIGDGAVIGAGSVVTHDVEPYEVVGGAPARHIRHRFDASTIQRLLTVKWWDWPDEDVRNCASMLQGDDVDEFLTASGY